MRGRREPIWVAPLIALGICAFVLVAIDAGGPVRALLVAAFSLLGPGAGMARALHLRSPIEQLALVVPFSLACTAVVAMAALYMGWWSPLGIMGVLILGTIGLLMFGGRGPRVAAES
jgi:hypothetical protein